MAIKKQQQKVKSQKKLKQIPKLQNKGIELKTADQITEKDELEFELGRLRTHLEAYESTVNYKDKELGKTFHFKLIVDPLNKTVAMMRTD